MKAFVLVVLLVPTQSLLSRPAVFTPQHCPRISTARAPAVLAADHTNTGVLQRVVSGLRNALFIGAASVLVRSPDAPQALAAKASPTPTKPAKDVNTNGLPALATIAMGGGLVYWSVKEAAEEDEEEQRRVVEETAKLESMQKEYTDIDEGVTVDEDLFASLRSRLNSTETITGSEADEGPDLGPLPPPPPSPPPSDSSGGGSAVLERPAPADEPSAEPTTGASAEDIERLKRMFGTTDDT